MISTISRRDKLVFLPPNRVWRSYLGGSTLERLAGKETPQDSHLSEDWIGSVTRAINPGREEISEGVSQVRVGEETIDFKSLIETDPEYFLGEDHVAKHGPSPMLLIKFLDPSIRLHFQCHPSNDFAQRFLNSPSGKTEAYHVLAVREDEPEPYIYVGFQTPPSEQELKSAIEEQNIAALEACFQPVRVQPGDTYLIPGGTPHALGPGIFMVEIQEPTDFVVRFEYERGGYVLPEAARFMGRDVDFGLSMVDRTPYSLAEVASRFACAARDRRPLAQKSWTETLIGSDQTPCFEVHQTHIEEPVSSTHQSCSINIVTEGELDVTIRGETHRLHTFDKFFRPAGLGEIQYTPLTPTARILECFPPA